jgi:hypothetical protein
VLEDRRLRRELLVAGAAGHGLELECGLGDGGRLEGRGIGLTGQDRRFHGFSL